MDRVNRLTVIFVVILVLSLVGLIVCSYEYSRATRSAYHSDGVVYSWRCPTINHTRICFHYVAWENQDCLIVVQSWRHIYDVGERVSVNSVDENDECILYTCSGAECEPNKGIYIGLVVVFAAGFIIAAVGLYCLQQRKSGPQPTEVTAELHPYRQV